VRLFRKVKMRVIDKKDLIMVCGGARSETQATEPQELPRVVITGYRNYCAKVGMTYGTNTNHTAMVKLVEPESGESGEVVVEGKVYKIVSINLKLQAFQKTGSNEMVFYCSPLRSGGGGGGGGGMTP
jgi:hypothetical protein